jgi:hypothetical protein
MSIDQDTRFFAGASSRSFSDASGPKASREDTPGFVNASDHQFTDISSEAERVYNFGQKGFVRINRPLQLAVSDSGGHRIFSADGRSHYIPAGWIEITWTTRPGSPHFVK